MPYFNLHTHHCLLSENLDSIYIYNQNEEKDSESSRYFSIGIHPWYITSSDLSVLLEHIAPIAHHKNCVAIGESGLDKLCSTPFELQESAFLSMILLSEQLKKPLIIHCVKAFNELLALHDRLKPKQAWIIHGFRGKPELAKQLIRRGIYLSFGLKFNFDTLLATPIDHIFIETDESTLPISTCYQQVALLKNMDLESLKIAINSRAEQLFNIEITE